ncbi:3398_t:CDS:10 [Cetraspora pellucida]|uniref:3398_t:CDS:1 n=1 Tax=Cetraspora pellucida TaxID=1433469 RepID=A0A9N9NT64_9GLOM|nr:3398_t:CDS:10 [Cetraspora pellucida]
MQMEYEITGKNDEFGDDTCAKESSHFEQASDFFSRLKILLEDAHHIETNNEDDIEQEINLTNLIDLINPYQEQPFLLDPHLENMVKPVIELLRTYIKTINVQGFVFSKDAQNKPEFIQMPKKIKRLFKLLYYLMKIRGYKTIGKIHDSKDYTGWETRYVLLIWLSLICMVPFDLKTVDSLAAAEENKFPLVDHMIELSKFYLKATGKERDGAAVFLSRLLTRRDIAELYLANYIKWAQDEVKNDKDVFTITGIITSLCAIYKLGQRQTLLPTLESVLPCLNLLEGNQSFVNNTLIRKLLVKLAQRIGLCYLKPKVASWRYHRGSRSLKDNLNALSKSTTIDPSNVHQSLEDEKDEDDEVPEQLEEIIEILLNGLRSKDTVVRWSAAKGIGRIAQRLPQELADDVIGSLFELFSENTYKNNDILELSAVSDHTWHGVCLAIAELARRGLLLPERLSEVIPWVTKALKFDQKRGSHSIGAHVRDAACYVCWSFARAYAPEIIAPYVVELANNLVVVSVFDREVNVRRASSAAFQENVGRQGIFPHGIEIITTADYFTVGNRVNAFLDISVKIAKFVEYRYNLIDHLSKQTISNWDKSMRVLGAKALHNLASLDLDYFINNVLPFLIPQALSFDVHTRHGALLAIGEICLAWSNLQNDDESWIERHKDLIKNIANIVGSLPEHAFTDFGSEVTVQAAVSHISSLAKARWPVTDEVLNKWKSVVYDLLSRKDEIGQEIAVHAVEALVAQHGIDESELDIYPSNKRDYLLCFTLALGVIEYYKIPECLDRAIESLILSSEIQETKVWNDPETRRNAIISLAKISKKFGDSFKTVVSKPIFDKIINAYFIGLEDYSTDQRGDVGSWVREACMNGFSEICPLIARLDLNDPGCEPWLSNELSIRIFSKLLKQSVERIDKIRSCAGRVLLEFLYMKVLSGNEEVYLFNLPAREILQNILPKDEEIHWTSPLELYPRMVKLLALKEYRFDLLVGLVIAAGGINESLVRYSSSALLDYANELPVTSPENSSLSLTEFANELLNIFRHNKKQDRITIPLLEVLDLLLESGTLQKINSDFFRHIRKITACMRILCGMTSLSGTVRNRSLYQLLSLLVHPFPKVRRSTADQLYLTLTGSIEDESEEMSTIEDILVNTDWDSPVPQLKELRNQLYPLLGLKQPNFKKPDTNTTSTS